MLKDIDKNTVDFVWDDTEKEPTVLPAKYPNLLVNGSTRDFSRLCNRNSYIISEIIDGTVYLIDHPNASLELMEYIPGPDFPTGGILQGKAEIKIRTNRGKVIRARQN